MQFFPSHFPATQNYIVYSLIYHFYFRYRFTQIAVDPQIKTPGGKTYDVIFVGTGESLFIYSIYVNEKQFLQMVKHKSQVRANGFVFLSSFLTSMS